MIKLEYCIQNIQDHTKMWDLFTDCVTDCVYDVIGIKIRYQIFFQLSDYCRIISDANI